MLQHESLISDNKHIVKLLIIDVMKTFKTIMVAMMMMVVTSASAMTYTKARENAAYLADKMAYELDLTDEQYEAVYQVNLDYFMNVNSHHDIYGAAWNDRNYCLRHILSVWQYDSYLAANYFYRPISWVNNSWRWHIYTRYTNPRLMYRAHPHAYAYYRGGNHRNFYVGRTWRHPVHKVARVHANYAHKDRIARERNTYHSPKANINNGYSKNRYNAKTNDRNTARINGRDSNRSSHFGHR